MSEDQPEALLWRKLYASEAKRNQNLTDPGTEAMRGLFEQIAFYAIIWGLALILVIGVTRCIAWLSPELPWWFGWFGLAATVMSGSLMLILMDSPYGKLWEGRARLWARQYGYPVILLLGIGLALIWESTEAQQTVEAQAQRAAMTACGQIPTCIRMAERMNQGNDVLSYLPR
ncbi:hypothetical protein ANOBCDAF_03424 [Pleomorphomonas sp. T1.2MG-36]|uniref:hypothetical protein n=1 Tax=Pleomorphomonas sp. T1.2MG-36 TaxID=3041167 RepID=UPI00247751A6|nr:hypothetical protein [Pleomorphomonas sp. T1.2MG-36]CAI9415285.1 hypothetical protein ANOBCDAF_03424 [Pleomorphomonas sp. T1.2MG-36]